jgi:hypothetical protein
MLFNAAPEAAAILRDQNGLIYHWSTYRTKQIVATHCEGERRVLRLAASLADGIPADLRDAFTGMDTANVDRAVRAMLHASGRRNGRH